MSNFQFHFPTITQCGEGLANQAGALLRPHVEGALLVVTDQGLIDAGILGGFFASLEQAGIDYHLFSAVEANPSTDVLDAAAAVAGVRGAVSARKSARSSPRR